MHDVNGEFYAITDTLHHAGASGKRGENIICGWHAASFELAKYRGSKIYKVTVENGDVFVEV